MSRYGGNDNYDFETDIEIDVDVDLDLYSDVDVYYSSDINIDANIDVDVDINGNLANFNVDVEAIGDDTFVELNLAVLTTDNLSMITASGTSAVG
ncbi:hypothetical protein [Teichococcus oryzae]|uniref:Uncharacterized protein n=1 Tax=Teichococcus oryzae TaxID=1608942 RepID=A0A5B2TBQ3_9PROT|nr:hypothetical protein [Pseudoroseomonas oryzae]KAA2211951.1 hypothetical protein F0Q34_17445 [Pseudoroseomonas oryzae]